MLMIHRSPLMNRSWSLSTVAHVLTSQLVHQFPRAHVRKGHLQGKHTHSAITFSEIITSKIQ